MKKLILFLPLLIFIMSCSKDDDPVPNQNEQKFTAGHGFRQVSHDYEDIQNGVQFVNKTQTVRSIHEQSNGYSAEHWVYQSPSLGNQEVGFSIVYPTITEGQLLDVVLFLHGSDGSENNGASRFFESYSENFDSQPKVLIFANGIYAPDRPGSTSVWKLREIDGRIFNHANQLMELISGILDDNSIFAFASKNTEQWSVTGFSAGGQICLGLFMDPLFIDNPVYKPKNNLPLGAWATDNFLDYFDFDAGLEKLSACSDEVDLTLANHLGDDVNCTGNKQYPLRSWLLNRFQSKDIRFTFLGLTDDSKACDPLAESNPVHSVKFYLRNSLAQSIKEVYCRDDSYLNQYTSVGDLLFTK